jgi:glycosyltransferase involved in cell wall biosynthesis
MNSAEGKQLLQAPSARLPKVSILIPAYNAERWIGQTLDSALAQTWPRVELIVVDDGSLDRTVEIAEGYQDRGVRVFRQTNSGAAVARERAFKESSGDYIQYLDADDLLSPDKIEKQVVALESNSPRLLAVCPVRYFWPEQKPTDGLLSAGWPFEDTDNPVGWLIGLLGGYGERGTVPIGCWLTPRGVGVSAGPWESVRSPDDDGLHFARAVLASSGIRRTGGLFYYRKLREGSLSTTRSKELLWGTLRTTELKAEALLARTDEPAARHALAKAFMDVAFSSYPRQSEITDAALEWVRRMGGTSFVPPFGTRLGEFVKRLLGWKAGRRLQVWYRDLRTSHRAPRQ